MKKLYLLFLLSSTLFSGMGQDNPVKNSYHNVTAHYNGYWIANERIKEVEQSIAEKYDWDFNQMLPIYPQFDTTTSRSLEDPLLDAIEKASIAIQRHPDSRWEDDAYNLVGLARLYGSEFPEAIETFKYVNTNGDLKEDRHLALIHLMRTFIEAKEMDNAQAVSDYIDETELSDESKKELAINRAYYYQKTGRITEMAENLQLAMSFMSGDEREARLAFTLGQALQSEGADSVAYYYYKRTIRKSKTYDLSFYARLNMSQVSLANSKASDKEIRRYFKKLLKDPKNEEYKGRILFEIGNFNYKADDLQEAISNYEESVKKNRGDTRLKSYTYLKLAEIYYHDLKDFRLAKSYYDSTANIYLEEEAGYADIKKRAEILTDFVTYYETIQTNDSLLLLASIPSDSLDIWLNTILEQRESEAITQAEKKRKEEKRAAIFETSQSNTNENLIDLNVENEGTWYFYNTTELSRGFSAFRNKWGQRVLEDNWRRSLKTGVSENSETESVAEPPSSEITSTDPEENPPENTVVFDLASEKESLLATIPFEQAKQTALLDEVEVATYELGKIYNFQLEEKENAISTFENFLTRFDSSRYTPEVIYQLYLLHKNKDSLKSAYYFEELTLKHDTSIYAKIAINPNYINERDQAIEDYKKIYVRAFDLYKSGRSKESQQLIDSALFSGPDNEYVDNLHLLSAMNYGELEGIYKYQFELSNFITNYSESDLAPYAQKLLKTSQDFQINLYTSSKAKFIKNFETVHYFILVYPFDPELTTEVPKAVEKFVKDEELALVSGSIVLDEEHAVVLVNEFDDKQSAEAFIALFQSKEQISSTFAPARFYAMVITDENFQIFYETKDLDSYITFFSKHYKQ